MRYLALVLMLPFAVFAKPIASAGADGINVTLTDEPCKLVAVTNLQRRATWTEAGRVTEGCWSVHPAGMVLFYFADLTVTLIPAEMFQKVSDT